MSKPLKDEKDPTPLVGPLSSLTPEQRAARYEELRRRAALSKIYARCNNPEIEVRWIRKDDPTDIAYHEWMGFTVATEPDPEAPRAKRRFDTAIPPRLDGTYICGDVILYEVPKDVYDFHLNQNRAIANSMISDGQKAFRDEAEKLEVATFMRDKTGRHVG